MAFWSNFRMHAGILVRLVIKLENCYKILKNIVCRNNVVPTKQ